MRSVRPRLMRQLARMVIVGGSALGAAVVVAVFLAVLNLYLTGHGYGSITREIITWGPAGVHLSAADLVLLMVVAAACLISWFLTGRACRSHAGASG